MSVEVKEMQIKPMQSFFSLIIFTKIYKWKSDNVQFRLTALRNRNFYNL